VSAGAVPVVVHKTDAAQRVRAVIEPVGVFVVELVDVPGGVDTGTAQEEVERSACGMPKYNAFIAGQPLAFG